MLVVKTWAKLTFVAKLIQLLEQMESATEKELQLWEEGSLDVIVSTPCRTFEIRYRPYGDEGKVHSVEIHYTEYKEVNGDIHVHDINDMSTIMEQLNKYFGLLEE